MKKQDRDETRIEKAKEKNILVTHSRVKSITAI